MVFLLESSYVNFLSLTFNCVRSYQVAITFSLKISDLFGVRGCGILLLEQYVPTQFRGGGGGQDKKAITFSKLPSN